MKRLFLCILCVAFVMSSRSQSIEGVTGLMKIPTAEMQADGTFLAGINYLPELVTPERFDYDTFNYFFNLTFLPFLEFSIRSTYLKFDENRNADRAFGLRFRLLNESRLRPSLVFGGNDLYSYAGNTGNQSFNSLYGVATKHFSVSNHQFGITLGWGKGNAQNENLDGLFAGVSFQPSVLPNLKFMAEYDSKVFNAGAEILLLKHVQLFGMAYNLRDFAGGLSFRLNLKN